MIRTPSQSQQISQPNTSDRVGNLWYTKNINLDNGDFRLSSRVVSLYNESSDADFQLPKSFGRSAEGTFYVDASDGIFNIVIGASGLTSSQNTTTDVAQSGLNTGSKWWQNRWYVSEDTAMSYVTSNGSWFDTGITLTAGVTHAIEVFRNRNTMVITNGNSIMQISTSHSTSGLTQLTIPADYEAVGVAYNNYKVGIVTRVANTITGQNTDAYFFTWNGTDTEAGNGVPIGSDTALAIVPYFDSWAILTRTGQWRYFTGAGFKDIGAFPIYTRPVTWGTTIQKSIYGDALIAEGDVLYANVNMDLNPFGQKMDRYMVNMPSGVHCLDPKIGIYHRYSPSVSPVYEITVTNANINTTDNTFTTANTIPSTGSPIKLMSTGTIGGIKNGVTYYVIKSSSTVFKLATSKANALAGTAIDITSTGDASNKFAGIEVLDYGASYFAGGHSGGIALFGSQDYIRDHMLFGNRLPRHDNASSQYYHLCFTIPDVENIGYFVTPRVFAEGKAESYTPYRIKYAPLDGTDKVIAKYRTRQIYGLPETTTRSSGSNNCSWTSDTVFTTTEDLFVSYTQYTAGTSLECEVISGAGAGFMAQVSSITYSTGTYTVTLAESVPGAASGRYCNAVIDHWIKAGEITASNQHDDVSGVRDFPVEGSHKFIQAKVEERGVNIIVEEVTVNNKQFKP